MNTKDCYHYTQCGLDNVYLKNGFEKKSTSYGEGVAIDDADGLHKAITKAVIDKTAHLTGSELRFLRVELDLSQKRFGEYLGKSDQSVALWEKNGSIPKEVDFLVRHIMRQTMGQSTSYMDEVDRLRNLDSAEYRDEFSFQESGDGWEQASGSC